MRSTRPRRQMKKIIFAMLDSILILSICTLIATAVIAIKYQDSFRHQLIWKSHLISHYRFKLSMSCFCDIEHSGATIEVRYGIIVSTTDKAGPRETIDSLFSITRSDLRYPSFKVSATYDPTYGFPTNISVDQGFTDGRTQWFVSGFEVLP